jgi:tRNA (guanine37-N1)-methyltransferase
MQLQVVTLFPDMVCQNPRDFTVDAHRTIDDRPYGGGPGMVMMYEPSAAAIASAKDHLPAGSPVLYLSPQGAAFDQATAQRLAGLPGLVLLAGRYEGIDERLIESQVDEELSLGDFVLSGCHWVTLF